jgi:hypothetical protein
MVLKCWSWGNISHTADRKSNIKLYWENKVLLHRQLMICQDHIGHSLHQLANIVKKGRHITEMKIKLTQSLKQKRERGHWKETPMGDCLKVCGNCLSMTEKCTRELKLLNQCIETGYLRCLFHLCTAMRL